MYREHTYVISDLKVAGIVGMFYKKELCKTNQKEFRVEKIVKREDNKPCDKCGNATIILLTVELVKKNSQN